MNRLSRKTARTLEDVMMEYIRDMKIASGLNEQLIYEAWDAVSGAGRQTVSKYVKNGTLYCSLASSVLRSRLYPQRDEIVRQINARLVENRLFVPDDPRTGLLSRIVLQ